MLITYYLSSLAVSFQSPLQVQWITLHAGYYYPIHFQYGDLICSYTHSDHAVQGGMAN